MPSPAACTVYFDGACPVCRREIAHYRHRAAGADIAWVDASTCDETALGGLPRADALSRLHVRAADGVLVSGAAAFAAIWDRVPGYRWLAAAASRRPLLRLMESAYAGFLRLRPLWRRARPAGGGEGDEAGPVAPLALRAVAAPTTTSAVAAKPDLPGALMAELRTDHAGEVGAAQFFRGVLAMAADGELRAVAARHLATELLHQQRIGRWLPAASRSRLLPLWRAAGWTAGAVSALLGSRAVFATVTAVERVVDRRYERRIERLAAKPHLADLRATLAACRSSDRARRCEAPVRRQARPAALGGARLALVGTAGAGTIVASRASWNRFLLTPAVLLAASGRRRSTR